MDSLFSFLEENKIYFSLGLMFLGMVLLGVYFEIPSKFLKIKRARKKDDLTKYLKEYMDDDGNILLEKLAKIWAEADSVSRYTEEEVERILDKAARLTEKELVLKAEHALLSSTGTSEEFFDKLPVEEKIASLFGESFLDDILQQELGDDISPSVRSSLAEEIWKFMESRSGNRKLYELSRDELRDFIKDIKESLGGMNFITTNRASDIANEVVKEVQKEEEESVTVSSKLVSLEGPSELPINNSYEGNLPSSIKDRLLVLGVSLEIVEKIYFKSDDFMRIQHLFDYLWDKHVEDIIKFYTMLYRNKDLKYFLNQSYEPVKLFKDFLVYVLESYNPNYREDSFYYAFGKVFSSCEFYNYLSLHNVQVFKKKRLSNPVLFTFLGIFSAFESTFSDEFKEISVNYIEKLVNYLNVRNEAVAYRIYTYKDRRGEEKEYASSYDFLGFVFNEDIYLVPKAIDIIFGKYFLVIPYNFRADFEMNFSSEYSPHVSKYRLVFGESKGERIEILTKLKRDSYLYSFLFFNLKHKENKIPNYKGLKEVLRV